MGVWHATSKYKAIKKEATFHHQRSKRGRTVQDQKVDFGLFWFEGGLDVACGGLDALEICQIECLHRHVQSHARAATLTVRARPHQAILERGDGSGPGLRAAGTKNNFAAPAGQNSDSLQADPLMPVPCGLRRYMKIKQK